MPIEKCLVEWNKSIAFRGRLDVEEGRDSSVRIFPIEKSQGIHGIPKVNANNEFACQEREYRPSSVVSRLDRRSGSNSVLYTRCLHYLY